MFAGDKSEVVHEKDIRRVTDCDYQVGPDEADRYQALLGRGPLRYELQHIGLDRSAVEVHDRHAVVFTKKSQEIGFRYMPERDERIAKPAAGIPLLFHSFTHLVYTDQTFPDQQFCQLQSHIILK